MRLYVMLLALAGLALAGCAEDPPTKEQDDFDESFDDELEATDDTGVIRGVVVDQAIVPIEGVKVTLQNTELETTTNADGQFGFADLDPGTYFIVTKKPGYDAVQSSVEVVAGEDKPPVLRVMMNAIEGYNPFSQTQVYEGFYQCGTSVIVVCAAPNILLGDGTTDDRSTPTLRYAAGAIHIQTEMVWESTQAISPELYFEMETLESGCEGGTFLANAAGPSPIRAIAGNETLAEHNVAGDTCGIYHSVFAGGAQGTPVGFAVQQDFTWFSTEFHGYQPPEDWWFIEDGELPPPM